MLRLPSMASVINPPHEEHRFSRIPGGNFRALCDTARSTGMGYGYRLDLGIFNQFNSATDDAWDCEQCHDALPPKPTSRLVGGIGDTEFQLVTNWSATVEEDQRWRMQDSTGIITLLSVLGVSRRLVYYIYAPFRPATRVNLLSE